jgi:hypothetical protein
MMDPIDSRMTGTDSSSDNKEEGASTSDSSSDGEDSDGDDSDGDDNEGDEEPRANRLVRAGPPQIDPYLAWATLGYKPHPGQQTFHNSDARFKVLVGGARFGKSRAAAREALRYLFAPGTTGWIVAPTYALGAIEFRYLVEDVLRLGVKPLTLTTSTHMRMVLPNGSSVEVKSAESPVGLLGEALDWVILAEAAHLRAEIWERFIRPRLVTRGGSAVIATTPRGANWIKEVFDRGQSDENPFNRDWASWRFPTAANPLIGADELASVRAGISSAAWDEQFEAAFVPRDGLVYPGFDRKRHVVRIPNAMRELDGRTVELVRGIDFGFVNPMVAVLIAIEPTRERFHVIAETSAQRETMGTFVSQIANADAALGVRSVAHTWGDPSAPGLMAEMWKHGLRVTAADNDIRSGIESVRWALESSPGRASPRMTIDPGCKRLLDEFETYLFAPDGVAGDLTETPVKLNDHALDALRYALAMVRRGGARWRVVR